LAFAWRGRRGALRAGKRALLDPMIRRSDDDAAHVIFTRVGTDGLRRLAHAARLSGFTPASPVWRLSKVSARDMTRFFLRIDRLLPTVVPAQRGIGEIDLPRWRLYFEGGREEDASRRLRPPPPRPLS
jgi:hypothetical protein